MPKKPDAEKIIKKFVYDMDHIISRCSRGIIEITLKIGDKKKNHTPSPDRKK